MGNERKHLTLAASSSHANCKIKPSHLEQGGALSRESGGLRGTSKKGDPSILHLGRGKGLKGAPWGAQLEQVANG
jgi:hypothetical protein